MKTNFGGSEGGSGRGDNGGHRGPLVHQSNFSGFFFFFFVINTSQNFLAACQNKESHQINQICLYFA